jgi:hypothetical protein
MPKIPEIFEGMEKFWHAMTINLSMGDYSMTLSDQAKKLCFLLTHYHLFTFLFKKMTSANLKVRLKKTSVGEIVIYFRM